MRRIKYLFISLGIVSLFSSCVNEIPFDEIQYFGEKTITIEAFRHTGDTKTTLGEGGSVLWSPNDSIGVFYGTVYQSGTFNKCVSNNTAPASSAKFTGKVPSARYSTDTDGYYYGFYPYRRDNYFNGALNYCFPRIQYAKKGSFGAEAFPSAARSKDLQMFFYNICGGIKFTVTKKGVNRITFKGNNGENISGNGSVQFDDNGRPADCHIWDSDDSKSLDLIAPEGGFEPGAPYYLILPPLTFTRGFTMTFSTDTEQAVRVVEKSVTIERSIFSKLTDADKSETYSKLPTAVQMLAGDEGLKYWLWDTTADQDGTVWGRGSNNGNGYPADDGFIPGGWWGSRPEDIADTESRFMYMTVDSDLNCVSYTEDGKEVRRGKLTVSDFSVANRADGWSLGKITTDAPAILWPYAEREDPVNDFDILRLTSDKMTLAHNCQWTTTGSNDTYYWWRFRSIDRSTFEKGRPTAISLDQSSVEIFQGDEITFEATITPEDRSFWGVQWFCDNESILSCQGVGRYGAWGDPGKATVTVKTVGGLTSSCEVTVKERIPVEEFTFDVNHLEMHQGETRQIVATILPENASLREVVWESSNPEIATVNADGLVTAVVPGWTQIIGATDGGRWQCWCSIYVRDNRVDGVNLDEYYLEMYPGDRKTISATVYPDYAENKKVVWSSFSPEIADVDSLGTVTAVAPGWTQIRVVTVDNGCEAYCSINVMPRAVTGVTIDKPSAELFVGDRIVLTATVLPENATNREVTWRSDKPEVATVDRNGFVKAVGSGTATVTVKTIDGEFTATCKLTIRSNGVEPGIGDWGDGEHHEGDTY